MTAEEPKRKRGRPRKADKVTKTRFAELCGFPVSSLHHYTGGVNPKVIISANDDKVDLKDPINAKFLAERQHAETKKQILEEAETDARLTIAEVMKKEADAKWKAVKARKETKELIDSRMVEKVFLMTGRTIRELLLPQGERVAPKVCAEFGNVNREMILKVQNIVDDENEAALAEIIDTLKKAIEEEEFFECFDD